MVIHHNLGILITTAVALMYAPGISALETVRRGRAEAVPGIRTSNVPGNGNISTYLHFDNRVSRQALASRMNLGAGIGLAELMSLHAQGSVVNFRSLGPLEVHLQMTTPGNDNLRFFGIGASADLYLSTTPDTTAVGASEEKPVYSPFLLPSFMMDLDWPALNKNLPLKTYFQLSLLNDAELYHEYSQLSFRLAAEWKGYQHSLYGSVHTALFRRRTKRGVRGDTGYEQMYITVEPGGRYRVFDKFSILGSIGLTVYKRVRENFQPSPPLVSASLTFEVPLIFRETNAEAIRTLVFLERRGKESDADYAGRTTGDSTVVKKLQPSLNYLEEEEESFDYGEEEQRLYEKRKAIREKVREIEELLEETE